MISAPETQLPSRFAARLLCLALATGALLGLSGKSLGQGLEIDISPVYAGKPLQRDLVQYTNLQGEQFSVTRASYLLDDIAVQKTDGTWLASTHGIAWMDAGKERNTLFLPDIPEGAYQGLRFFVGPGAALNHTNTARFPADHPLNPNLNGLHWGWQGGYIFMALEGMWKSASPASPNGWSYHLAGDNNRTQIELPRAISIPGDGPAKIEIELDISTILNGAKPVSFLENSSSTHSRPGDPIAHALTANLSKSFQIRKVSALPAKNATPTPLKPLYLPEKFTPYPFQMSSTFPIPDLPRDNPLTIERVELGKRLFQEKLLSRDDSISCAKCHDAKQAFAESIRLSEGVGGRTGSRNAMPLFNLAWKNSFFWDGRAASLREQALMPIQEHREMDEKLSQAAAKLNGGDGTAKVYPSLFTAAFGSAEITPEKIGLALESFLLTLTSFDSKLDRALRGEIKLSVEEQHGMELFTTEYDPRRGQFGADCFHCHGGALFQSQSFANNGLDAEIADPGRALVTHKPSDNGKFAVPSLRNVAVTGPYMHDGRFATLEQVVAHYSTGVQRSDTLDPNLAKHPVQGLQLGEADQRALIAFLKCLTDEAFLIRNSEIRNGIQ